MSSRLGKSEARTLRASRWGRKGAGPYFTIRPAIWRSTGMAMARRQTEQYCAGAERGRTDFARARWSHPRRLYEASLATYQGGRAPLRGVAYLHSSRRRSTGPFLRRTGKDWVRLKAASASQVAYRDLPRPPRLRPAAPALLKEPDDDDEGPQTEADAQLIPLLMERDLATWGSCSDMEKLFGADDARRRGRSQDCGNVRDL